MAMQMNPAPLAGITGIARRLVAEGTLSEGEARKAADDAARQKIPLGAWLVENGEIISPVRNFRFTQSYPQALGPSSVIAVGTHAIAVPNNYSQASFRCPALHLASWNFTGGASG